MEIKQIEIRDRGTFIPALAIKCSGRDGYILEVAGYSTNTDYVLLIRIEGSRIFGETHPNNWTGRTLPIAHQYIIDHWDEIENKGVVCVEYILGERKTPKTSERMEPILLPKEATYD